MEDSEEDHCEDLKPSLVPLLEFLALYQLLHNLKYQIIIVNYHLTLILKVKK